MYQQFESLLILAVLSVTYSHVLFRHERLRLAVAHGRVPNLLNTWVLCGAVLLPPRLAVALTVIALAGDWPARKAINAKPLRYLSSGLIHVGAVLAASAAMKASPGGTGTGVAVAVLIYASVTLTGVAIACVLLKQRHNLAMFRQRRNWVDEATTSALGAAAAVAMHWDPLIAVCVAPFVVWLHRDSLRTTAIAEAAFDPESGLWREADWKFQAQVLLAEARYGRVLLLIIDPNYPEMESLVRRNLGASVQSVDPVGRYGTRQIVLALHIGPGEPGGYVADIRGSLAAAGILATLGHSVSESPNTDLEELLLDAGQDLMQARADAGVTLRW